MLYIIIFSILELHFLPPKQLLFIGGIFFIIGPQKTFNFFFQSHKLKGTLFFFGGIFVVLMKWPIVGMLIELYGAFVLFR